MVSKRTKRGIEMDTALIVFIILAMIGFNAFIVASLHFPWGFGWMSPLAKAVIYLVEGLFFIAIVVIVVMKTGSSMTSGSRARE
ncbi:MAG: hypothetical protein M0Z77_08465 [Thermoplasmatales archaeon]|jgi:hypothetical protein|nr:hypothetical protein [Candidatus Thermoplasmatota archaeon]MDA8055660.1 hypothetical protein [Thermoplasmatales archaeon]